MVGFSYIKYSFCFFLEGGWDICEDGGCGA